MTNRKSNRRSWKCRNFSIECRSVKRHQNRIWSKMILTEKENRSIAKMVIFTSLTVNDCQLLSTKWSDHFASCRTRFRFLSKKIMKAKTYAKDIIKTLRKSNIWVQIRCFAQKFVSTEPIFLLMIYRFVESLKNSPFVRKQNEMSFVVRQFLPGERKINQIYRLPNHVYCRMNRWNACESTEKKGTKSQWTTILWKSTRIQSNLFAFIFRFSLWSTHCPLRRFPFSCLVPLSFSRWFFFLFPIRVCALEIGQQPRE